MISKDAILAHDGDDVCRNTDGAQIKQGNKLRELNAVADGKSLYEFETNATSTEMLVWISVVKAFGIEDSQGWRQLVARHMMVADYEVDAFFLGVSDFFDSLDAAIQHDNKTNSSFLSIVHTFSRDSISVFVPVRNIVVYVAVELLEEAVY